MAKYFDWITGKATLVLPVTTSAGAGDATKMAQLDSNGKWDQSLMPAGLTPDQKTANANGAISARDLCYVEAAGTIARASAASGGFESIGWATAAALSGAPVTIQMEGIIAGLSGLTPGSAYYLSDVTPGALMIAPGPTTSLTGKLGQFIGTALSATELTFEPERAVVLN